ncbi:uncharacterized protein I206_105167 [Kwoniella pini CBS 10737]|uniref:Histone acetyltransferase n=1 Tax=Kwoniella pini CBS 10737 TaxID=1296096 RepID=A0A1B9I4Z7_9TREE|nr:uncharacterized protein I206_03923 [Kwoniella pini CBS 10737]OCF50598.1 hypothetical protein I206_03923 [Kwoniella pini CBS 10737]
MRTPTRSSSRPSSIRSGLSHTPSKPFPPLSQNSADIPIDPALLDEDNDLDDAEGELVDDDLDLLKYNKDEHHLQYDQIPPSSSIQPYHLLPNQNSRINIFSPSNSNTNDAPSPRKQARVARSSTSLSTPQPNGHKYQHDDQEEFPQASSSTPKSRPSIKEKGKGKGKGKGNAKTSEQIILAREEICSFCGGNDNINRKRQAERMASCSLCGRSGHPSCLSMGPRMSQRIMQYDWQCIECKTCEICKVKGDDSRLMFCDTCDRGWHSFCLVPKLAKPPKGSWHCPLCVNEQPPLSVSRSAPTISNSASRKGKQKAIETGSLDDVSTPSNIGRPKKHSKINLYHDEDYEVYEEIPPSRIKVKISKREPDKVKSGGRSRKRRDELEDEGTPMIVRLRVPHPRKAVANGVEDDEAGIVEDQAPYGGIIEGSEADTSKTKITEKDKEEYERSRKLAENRLGGPPPLATDSLPNLPNSPMASPGPGSPFYTPNKAKLNGSASTPSLSRGLRDRLLHQSLSANDASPGYPFPQTPNQHQHHPPTIEAVSSGKLEKINKIRFGQFDIDTWYSAPYPEEYVHVPDGRLWLCEFCLKYMKSGFVAGRHRLKCKVRHPPGDEIYRDGSVSVFEVDGRKNKIYCQNLCLLAKMFLDHKTLYYDVEPFLFYVMTEVDELGARFVGYFSKEKRSMDNNVSCIMTLPVRQRKGWGQLLIDFSYALSKKEGRVGSPEKPLSGLGAVTYKGYWKLSVFRYLIDSTENVTLVDISLATSMTLEDIYSTLLSEDMIRSHDDTPSSLSLTPVPNKTPKSRHRNRRKIPVSAKETDEDETTKIPDKYSIIIDKAYIEAVLKKHDQRGYLVLRPERLKYHPFLVTRNPLEQAEKRTQATLDIIGQDTSVNGNNIDVEKLHTPSSPKPTEEEIVKGTDQATLNLVAELSASPARSLRRKREFQDNSVSPIKNTRSRSAMHLNGHANGHDQTPTVTLSPYSRKTRNHLKAAETSPITLDHSQEKGELKQSLSLNGLPSTGQTVISTNRKRIIMTSDTEEEEQIEYDKSPLKNEMNGYHDPIHPEIDTKEDQEDINGDVQFTNDVSPNEEQGINVDAEGEEEEYLEMDAEGEDEDAEGEEEDAEGEDDDEYVG